SYRLRAHAAAEVDAEAVRRPEAVLELAEDLLVVDDLLDVELAEDAPRLLEPAHRVDGRLARILAAGLHVEVHLADLERPLDDRLEVLLLDLAVRPQAEVVRELADVGLVVRLVEDLLEQAVPELARLVERLLVDALDDRRVVLAQVGTRDERVDDLVHMLRDRALLRALGVLVVVAQRRVRVRDLLGREG